MFADPPGETARVGTGPLAYFSELVACEVDVSGTREERSVAGRAELASVPRLVAIEGLVSKSPWETSEVVLGTGGLVSAGWATKETVDSDSRRDSARGETVVLVSVPEPMTSEVTVASVLGETVITGVAELASAP